MVVLSVLAVLHSARILHVTLPRNNPFSKKNLHSKLVKENRQWERELSLTPKFSVSKSLGSRWGISTLNKHFAKERGQSLRGTPVSAQKINLMSLSDRVFDFIGKHRLTLKGQKDKASSLRFALNLRKNADAMFQVDIKKKGDQYGVAFMSREPYMLKSLKVQTEEDLDNKMGTFLDRSLRNWKKFSARRLSVVSRHLMGLDQIPQVMESVAGDEFEIKPEEKEEDKEEKSQKTEKDAKSNESGAEEDEEGGDQVFDLIDKEDGVVIAKIEIKKGESEEDLPKVEMSNMSLPEFESAQKIASRSVGPQDTKEDMQLFFKPHFEDFKNRYETWKLNKKSLNDLKKIIMDENSELEDRKIDDEVSVGDEEDPTMIILRDWKKKDMSAFFQANLYKINKGYMGLHVIQGNNELEMQVPVTMNDDQKTETAKSIKRIMSSGEYTQMVDYDDAKLLFVDSIENLECGKPKPEAEEEGVTVYVIDDSEKCVFSGNTFVLTNLDFDGMRYVHLVLDTDYFKGEHFITMTTETAFRDNLNRVILESKSQLASVDDAYKRSQEPVKTELSNIQELIKEVAEDKLEESEEDGTLVYKAKVHGRDSVIIKVKKVEQDDQPALFRIITFDVFNDKNPKKPRSHHEFIIYENNGYDQLEVLKAEIEKVVSKLEGE